MELYSKQNITIKWNFTYGVSKPKLLNIPFASCFLINFDFLAPHIAHFDILVLRLLVFETTRTILYLIS